MDGGYFDEDILETAYSGDVDRVFRVMPIT
jgi:hypothetical protein